MAGAGSKTTFNVTTNTGTAVLAAFLGAPLLTNEKPPAAYYVAMAAATTASHLAWRYGGTSTARPACAPQLWPLRIAPGNTTVTSLRADTTCAALAVLLPEDVRPSTCLAKAAPLVDACAIVTPLLPAPTVNSCPEAAAPKAPVSYLVAPLTQCQAGAAPPLVVVPTMFWDVPATNASAPRATLAPTCLAFGPQHHLPARRLHHTLARGGAVLYALLDQALWVLETASSPTVNVPVALLVGLCVACLGLGIALFSATQRLARLQAAPESFSYNMHCSLAWHANPLFKEDGAGKRQQQEKQSATNTHRIRQLQGKLAAAVNEKTRLQRLGDSMLAELCGLHDLAACLLADLTAERALSAQQAAKLQRLNLAVTNLYDNPLWQCGSEPTTPAAGTAPAGSPRSSCAGSSSGSQRKPPPTTVYVSPELHEALFGSDNSASDAESAGSSCSQGKPAPTTAKNTMISPALYEALFGSDNSASDAESAGSSCSQGKPAPTTAKNTMISPALYEALFGSDEAEDDE